jgi:integrase/recombinase XerD
LTWSDVLPRDEGLVQLSITGRGGKVRQVLLPETVSHSLLSFHGDAGANDPVFASRNGGGRLTERAVNGMVERTEKAVGINVAVSHQTVDTQAASRSSLGGKKAFIANTRASGDFICR